MNRIVLTTLLLLSSWPAFGQQGTYRNPLDLPESQTHGVSDPCVIRHLGRYYLYASSPASTGGIRVWESEDLIHWRYRGLCFRGQGSPMGIWAPEVIYLNGEFFLYFSGNDIYHRVASSNSPTGPFTLVTNTNIHSVRSIDGSVFQDDDGQLSFLFAAAGGIRTRRMTSPTELEPGPSPYLGGCVVRGQSTRATLPNDWTEAPKALKLDGTYYVGYTGNDYFLPSYRTLVSRGRTLRSLRRQSAPLHQKSAGSWTGSGSNTLVWGPDLKTLYSVYHLRRSGKGFYRSICVDPVSFDTRRNMVSQVSITPRALPARPHVEDHFETRLQGWRRLGPGNWTRVGSRLEGSSRGAGWAIQRNSTKLLPTEFTAEVVLRVQPGSGNPMAGAGVAGAQGGRVFAWLDRKRNALATYCSLPKKPGVWRRSPLPPNWRFDRWQTLRLVKRGDELLVYLDGMLKQRRSVPSFQGGYLTLAVGDAQAAFAYAAASQGPAGPPRLQRTFREHWQRAQLGPDWFKTLGRWGLRQQHLWGDHRGIRVWSRVERDAPLPREFRAEVRIRLIQRGTGQFAKYGVSLFAEGRGPSVWIDPKRHLLALHLEGQWINSPLPKGLDLRKWHTLVLELRNAHLGVSFAGRPQLRRPYTQGAKELRLGFVLQDCWANYGLVTVQ